MLRAILGIVLVVACVQAAKLHTGGSQKVSMHDLLRGEEEDAGLPEHDVS